MSKNAVAKTDSPGWLKSIDKFRNDIAIANPVSFLVQVMNGQEFQGEKLSLRDRVEVAKYLAGRVVPTVSPEERGLGSGQVIAPPPLTIIMHARPDEVREMKTVDMDMAVGDDYRREGDDYKI